jgi:hypothetical protein
MATIPPLTPNDACRGRRAGPPRAVVVPLHLDLNVSTDVDEHHLLIAGRA